MNGFEAALVRICATSFFIQCRAEQCRLAQLRVKTNRKEYLRVEYNDLSRYRVFNLFDLAEAHPSAHLRLNFFRLDEPHANE